MCENTWAPSMAHPALLLVRVLHSPHLLAVLGRAWDRTPPPADPVPSLWLRPQLLILF